MMNHKKLSILLVLILALITVCGVGIIYLNRQNGTAIMNANETFLGEWTAKTYIAGGVIQRTDFFPEKYIGNKMSIGKDYFYMEDWNEILNPIKVENYIFLEENINSYIDKNRIAGNLDVDSDSLTILAYDTTEGVQEEIGIVIDDSHLICATGSGWYMYEKI